MARRSADGLVQARAKLNRGEPVWALGFMTGTSLDGVDAALIQTDGVKVWSFGPCLGASFDPKTRDLLQGAVSDARTWGFDGPEPQSFGPAAAAHARACAAIGAQLIADFGATPDIIGLHGQTVLHRARIGDQPAKTRQIADAGAIAGTLSCPVVYDFRTDDVVQGGEGAPLAPVYHRALLGDGRPETAVLNLGGVANLTFFGSSADQIIAFDCGPANGPIDEWVSGHDRGSFDVDGRFAALGTAHEGLLADWLDHPFFDAPPPKSLDRYDFSASLARGLSFEDGCATFVAFAARAIAQGLRFAPAPITQVIACGGGRRNPTLLAAIEKAAGVQITDADELGWRGDFVEAEAFAFMAVRRLLERPISFPGTTGVPNPSVGGRIYGD